MHHSVPENRVSHNMTNEESLSKFKVFGRFPKSNFTFESPEFIAEYKKIISSDVLFNELLVRMSKRYGNNEIEKQTVLCIVKNLKLENVNEDSFCEILGCDRNLIFLIGKDLDVSIRLFAKKLLYAKDGKNEEMVDEFGFTPKTFNYLYKRGYCTKRAIVQAYKNGYIVGEKIKSEIAGVFFPEQSAERQSEKQI